MKLSHVLLAVFGFVGTTMVHGRNLRYDRCNDCGDPIMGPGKCCSGEVADKPPPRDERLLQTVGPPKEERDRVVREANDYPDPPDNGGRRVLAPPCTYEDCTNEECTGTLRPECGEDING